MGEIRINKIIKKYNIGIQTLVDFLKKKHGVEVEANPNIKISDKYMPDIDKQYGKDLALKEASEKVEIKLTEMIETTTSGKNGKDDTKGAEQNSNTDESDFDGGETTIIKTNKLDPVTDIASSKKKSNKEEKKTETKPAASNKTKATPHVETKTEAKKVMPEVKAETKAEKQPEVKPETKTEVKTESKIEVKKNVQTQDKVEAKLAETTPQNKAEVKTKAQAEDKIESTEKANTKEEKKAATETQAKTAKKETTMIKASVKAEKKTPVKTEKIAKDTKQSDKAKQSDNKENKDLKSKQYEKEERKDSIAKNNESKDKKKTSNSEAGGAKKPNAEKAKKKKDDGDDSGLTIVGKIDLSQFEPKKKKRKKKRERIKKDAQKVDVSKVKTDASKSGGKKRKKRDERATNNEGSGKKRKNRKRRGNEPMTEAEKEEMQKEIQKQVKETYAKMNETKTFGSKRRKEKREQTKQKVQEMLAQEANEEKLIKVTEFVTVNDLATLMNNTPVNQVIQACMSLGLMVSINQRLDAETIVLVAEEFGYKIEFVTADLTEAIEQVNEDADDEKDMVSRPPIITVMGHVDHGKTSLLDYVRKANVIAGEAGGITQHIGAYNVTLANGRQITFLDTPGHEAFTAMRARGAQMTDLAIIIIAADDAVMPQTIEAINHAQAAGVPMVFAINKIDKPGAQPEKIRQQLSQMNILVEDWGGTYQCQEISAKKGLNVDKLLEKVLLETDLLELKANPNKHGVGAVIESSLDKGRGYLATVLIQEGTMNVGDVVLSGSYSGRVKAMFNERGQNITEAGPSTPVLVLGLNGAPSAGEKFNVMDDEREAKDIANKREQLLRMQDIKTQKHMTLEEIGRRIAIGNFKELNLIVKGDVDGSVEALSDSLIKLSTEQVRVNVIHKAVGAISESDILLAEASDAIIIGFQVRPSSNVRKMAEQSGIEIRLYSIIYDAINEVTEGIEGMLEPVKKEEITASVDVKQIFKISKVGTIAGCMVKEGKLTKAAEVRLIRDGIVVYTGKIDSLKRGKDDAKEVGAGYECGLNIANFNDVKVGDVIEAFKIVEIKQSL